MDKNGTIVERMEWPQATRPEPLRAPIPIHQGKRGRLEGLRHSA
jgi:hypothetical protein